MIYIRCKDDFVVEMVHYMPFDEKHGLRETKEELEKTGYFIEAIHPSENVEGFYSIMKYNPETKNIYYTYEEKTEKMLKRDKLLTMLAEGIINEEDFKLLSL